MRMNLPIIALAIFAYAFPLTARGDQSSSQIAVTGQGVIIVEPDMARLTVGVTKQARLAAEAVDLMSVDLSLVISALIESGVTENDIQTSQLQVNPQHSYDNANGSSKLVGYVANSTVTVQVLDLDELPGVLDEVLSKGANQLNGLQFDVVDRAPHLEAARRAAVANAMEKAGVFADAAGVKLGRLISLREGGASHETGVRAFMSDSPSESVPVMAGEIRIDAKVDVIYALDE